MQRLEGGDIGEKRAGAPLGIIEDHVYEAVTGSISTGEVVVLYTDGMNEALDDQDRLFGIGKLKQTLVTAPCRDPQGRRVDPGCPAPPCRRSCPERRHHADLFRADLILS
jgi:hypothetical protein